jgi:hypothetical protein
MNDTLSLNDSRKGNRPPSHMTDVTRTRTSYLRSYLLLGLFYPPKEFNTMDFSVDPVQSVPREFLAVILAGFGNE